MTAIGMHSRATCLLPWDLAGPDITINKSCLYHAAFFTKVVIPQCGAEKIVTAFCGSKLAIKDDKQGRSPPGGAVCA